MSLVQTSYLRYIITLANKFGKDNDIALSQLETPTHDVISILEGLLPPEPEQASLRCILAKLPAELADAMERLARDGFDGGKYLRKKWDSDAYQTRGKIRETTTEYWERVLGQSNVPEKLTALLYD